MVEANNNGYLKNNDYQIERRQVDFPLAHIVNDVKQLVKAHRDNTLPQIKNLEWDTQERLVEGASCFTLTLPEEFSSKTYYRPNVLDVILDNDGVYITMRTTNPYKNRNQLPTDDDWVKYFRLITNDAHVEAIKGIFAVINSDGSLEQFKETHNFPMFALSEVPADIRHLMRSSLSYSLHEEIMGDIKNNNPMQFVETLSMLWQDIRPYLSVPPSQN